MPFKSLSSATLAALLLSACGGSGDGASDTLPDDELTAFGKADGADVLFKLTEIASARNGLDNPRDLAFNPLHPDQLWVVNHGDDSAVIIHDASTTRRRTEKQKDAYALHFMARPAALAFGGSKTTIGKPGTFATCGESRNTYDDRALPNDFMGPTLWSSDLSVFAQYDPTGLGSHLDMLHNSPLCVGIAWETGNAYWAFGGLDGALFRYDFNVDDGIGNDDHSDGTVRQYATGEVSYVKGVSSHLVYRTADKSLYVADTGNARIARLDTTTGEKGRELEMMEPMAGAHEYDGAALTDVVPASSGQLERPSGLELLGKYLYVSDNANGRISAFTLKGKLAKRIETGLPKGSLGGMAFGPDKKLYFVDMTKDRVLRVDPQ
jgi:hypothetical protein